MQADDNTKIKILVADDEVDFATTVLTRLNMRGFDVSTVHSGREIVGTVEEQKPDILILDLKMPDMDGLEVLQLLREKKNNVKVIIVTGHGSFEAGRTGMELGAFDYIMKPVDLNLLIKKIQEACRQ